MEIKKIQAAAELAAVQKSNITNQTEKAAKTVKNSISVNDVDTDSEIIQRESVKTLTKDNSEELISNSKGTTYVVVGKDGCGRCRTFENKVLDTLASNLEGKADFVELDCEKQRSLYLQLKKESGDKSGSVGLPAIIKVVDGKAVEFMQYSDYSRIYSNADKMTEFLGDKVSGEKTEKSSENAKTTKTSTTSGKINKTTSKNVKANLYNQKGTTFVELTGQGCSICKGMEPSLKTAAKELGDSANFISVTYEEDQTLFWKLLKEAGYDEKSAPIPIMIKYVDGKPVEIMKRNDLTGHKNNLTQYLGKKVEKADERKAVIEAKKAADEAATAAKTKEEEDCPECQIKADDDAQNEGNVKEDSEQIVMKQKLEALKESLNITKNLVQTITSDSLQNAIEGACSIDELKTAVNTYSTGLDFNTQINLSSVANNLTSDSDLDAAKEKLLELL